jgi:hypothetical protein
VTTNNTSVNINQAANLIATCGTNNTFVFQGEPGIGKSAMLKMLGDRLNIQTRYVDCTLLDLGDIQMPKVHDTHVSFVPNEVFLSDEPIAVMLDELGKAPTPVKNALLPLVYEHRVGNYHLPEGSIVFATTNLATDGVGDALQSHAKNRVTFLTMRKPTADEWMEWGVNNDVAPELLAWVKEYPHSFASYTDGEAAKDNLYIFNPTKQSQTLQTAFVSPRSLYHASHIVKQRINLDDDTLKAALAGTVGKEAAADIQAFLSVADALPSFASIVENPATAKLPSNDIASMILSLGAVMRVDRNNVNAWMEYLRRLPHEVQFVFAQNAMRSGKAGVVATSKGFTDWARDNSWAV